VFTAAFCLFITWNVIRSVMQMTPSMPPEPQQLVSVRECADRGQKLWRALEAARRSLSEATGNVRDAHESWAVFRNEWVQNLRIAQAECGIHHKERQSLRVVFSDLEELENLYTTHAVQYAGELGPALKRFHQDLDSVPVAQP
jgi:hypothetical protein